MASFQAHAGIQASSSSFTMSIELIGLQCQLNSPSLSCGKWYSFCSVSSPQSSMSSAHSLCSLPLLFFPSITPNSAVLNFLSLPIQAHFLPYCFLQDRLFPFHSTE